MMPMDYARQIAKDRTLAGRRLHLHRAPPEFRDLVAKTAGGFLASQIATMKLLEERRAALTEVPDEIRPHVELHLRNHFMWRAELRKIEQSRERGAVDLFADAA